uniref:Uncharacterized protein n=1 Tax=Timema genevievae TaxID=629358 RepID=A0A7R9PLK0_TIMGE|nr:unnamed protein product [Timema genevievae]
MKLAHSIQFQLLSPSQLMNPNNSLLWTEVLVGYHNHFCCEDFLNDTFKTTWNTSANVTAIDEPRPETYIVPILFSMIFCGGCVG